MRHILTGYGTAVQTLCHHASSTSSVVTAFHPSSTLLVLPTVVYVCLDAKVCVFVRWTHALFTECFALPTQFDTGHLVKTMVAI